MSGIVFESIAVSAIRFHPREHQGQTRDSPLDEENTSGKVVFNRTISLKDIRAKEAQKGLRKDVCRKPLDWPS